MGIMKSPNVKAEKSSALKKKKHQELEEDSK